MPPDDDFCQRCGACCASYRVSFFWSEADCETGGIVPSELTETLPPWWRCMKGTNDPPPTAPR